MGIVNVLSPESIVQLVQTAYKSPLTPLNQRSLDELIALRTLYLAGGEVFSPLEEGLGVASKVGSKKLLKTIMNVQEEVFASGSTAVDDSIDQLIREMTETWREQLASKETQSPIAMKTSFYLRAIDQMENFQLPVASRQTLKNFVLEGLANTAIRNQKDITALKDGLKQAVSIVDADALERLSTLGDNLFKQFDAVSSTVARLRSTVSFNTKDIAELKSNVGMLNRIVDEHEIRIQDLEVVTSAMVDAFKKVDTLGLEKLDADVMKAYKKYQSLLASGVGDDLILKEKDELEALLKTRVDAVDTWKTNLNWLKGGAQAVGMLGKVLEKPELVQAGQVINGLAQMGVGLTAFLGGSFGAATATTTAAKIIAGGAVLGPVAAIAGGVAMIYMSFKASSSGGGISAALSKISEQIQALSRQIHKLGMHLDTRLDELVGRFDRLEDLLDYLFSHQEDLIIRTFNNMVDLLDDLRGTIIEEFTKTQDQIRGAEVLIKLVDDDIARLSQFIDTGFRRVLQDRYQELKDNLEYYNEQKYGEVPCLGEREVRDTVRELVRWVTESALDPRLHGDEASDYKLSTLKIVSKKDDVLNYTNLLLLFLKQSLGIELRSMQLPEVLRPTLPGDDICEPLSQGDRAVNPNVWREGVRDFIHFLLQTPEVRLLPRDICFFRKIIQAGEHFLTKNMALQTNTELFPKLLNGYESAFSAALQQMYLNVIAELKVKPSDIFQTIADTKKSVDEVQTALHDMLDNAKATGKTLDLLNTLVLSSCSMYYSPNVPPGSEGTDEGDDNFLRSSNLCYNGGEMYLNAHQEGAENFFRARVKNGAGHEIDTVSAYSISSVTHDGEPRFYVKFNDYVEAKDCHANNNYKNYGLLQEISQQLALLIENFKPVVDSIVSHLSEFSSSGAALIFSDSPVDYKAAHDVIFNDDVRRFLLEYASFEQAIKTELIKVQSIISALKGINLCRDFTFFYFDGPVEYKDLRVYENFKQGVSHLKDFLSLFSQVEFFFVGLLDKIAALKLSIDDSRVNFNRLSKKVGLSKNLEFDVLLLNKRDMLDEDQKLLTTLPSYEQVTKVLNQWNRHFATREELSQVQAGFSALTATAEMRSVLEEMDQYHHALWLCLPFVFGRAFDEDAISNEMIRAMWTGKSLSDSMSAFDSAKNQTFPLLSVEESFFPVLDGQSYSLLQLMRDLLNQTAVENYVRYLDGNLTTGYIKIHADLERLYSVAPILTNLPERASVVTTNAPELTSTTVIPPTETVGASESGHRRLTAEQWGLLSLGTAFVSAIVGITVFCKTRRRSYAVGPAAAQGGVVRVLPALLQASLFIVSGMLSFLGVATDAATTESVFEAEGAACTDPISETQCEDNLPPSANKHSFFIKGTAVQIGDHQAYYARMPGYDAYAFKDSAQPYLFEPIAPMACDPSTIRPAEVFGRPSVVCEERGGEGYKTTLVFQPDQLPAHQHVKNYLVDQGMHDTAATLITQPFADVTGNFMLGQVVWYLGKQTYHGVKDYFQNWWGGVKPAEKKYLNQDEAVARLKVLNKLLVSDGQDLLTFKAKNLTVDMSGFEWKLEDMQEMLAKWSTMSITQEEVNMFYDCREEYQEALAEFQSDILVATQLLDGDKSLGGAQLNQINMAPFRFAPHATLFNNDGIEGSLGVGNNISSCSNNSSNMNFCS